MTDRQTIRKAIQAANKKIRFLSHKETAAMLEYAADDKAEAYRIGSEETQREIVERLVEIADTLPTEYKIGSITHRNK